MPKLGNTGDLFFTRVGELLQQSQFQQFRSFLAGQFCLVQGTIYVEGKPRQTQLICHLRCFVGGRPGGLDASRLVGDNQYVCAHIDNPYIRMWCFSP